MKLIIEYEAEGLHVRDVVNPLAHLAYQAAMSTLDVKELDSGTLSGLTPDGRELKISWRVEA